MTHTAVNAVAATNASDYGAMSATGRISKAKRVRKPEGNMNIRTRLKNPAV